LLLGALPLLMFPWVLLKSRELTQEPRSHVSFYFFVLPFAFFLFQALKGKLEANWGLVCYIAFWPLAQRLIDYSSFRFLSRSLLIIGFAIPIACSGAILLHALHPLGLVSPEKDRLYRLRAQYDLSQKLASDVEFLRHGETLYLPSYQWTAYLRFQQVPSEQFYPDSRESHFTMSAKNPCAERSILVFREIASRPNLLNCFPGRRVLRDYPLVVRGKELARFQLVKYFK
jgi:hypothetical protein